MAVGDEDFTGVSLLDMLAVVKGHVPEGYQVLCSRYCGRTLSLVYYMLFYCNILLCLGFCCNSVHLLHVQFFLHFRIYNVCVDK